MPEILYRGILSTTHSWAIVGTELCLALYKHGCDIKVFSTNGTVKCDPRLKPLMETSHAEARVGLGYTIPRNIKHFHSKRRVCIYNYETTILPPNWTKHLNSCDLILPSSNFAKQIFLRNGVDKNKLVVLPHGFDPDRYNPDIQSIDLGINKFKFLCVAQPHARKGLDLLLRAYAEEFASSEDVALIIKTSYARARGSRPHYEIDIKQLLQQHRQRYAMPEVRIFTKKLDTVAELYNACDAFVLPTRSECFCLPALEAMACKLPVIITGYGGQTDFATKTNSYLINYKMTKAPKTMQYWHYSPRAEISEPDVEHLKILMRHVYNKYNDAQKRAELAYEQIRDRFTWDQVALQLLEMLNRKHWISLRQISKKKKRNENILFFHFSFSFY